LRRDLMHKVHVEEEVAIQKWGHVDRTPTDLLAALLEETGEVAHAINHDEGLEQTNQEITEAIGVLSRLYNMINGHIVEADIVKCTTGNPCCERRGEYNGFGSGPLLFICPKHCSCHD